METLKYRFAGRELTSGEIDLGMQGDTRARALAFALPELAEGQLAYLRLGTPTPMKAPLERQGDLWTWTISGGATARAGEFAAQVEIFLQDALLWNSKVFRAVVGESLNVNEEIQPVMLPELLQAEAALAQVVERAEEILDAVSAEEARAAAEEARAAAEAKREALVNALRQEIASGSIDGSGGLQQVLYDANSNGVVDDAERLGGVLPSGYAKAEHVHSVEDVDGLEKALSRFAVADFAPAQSQPFQNWECRKITPVEGEWESVTLPHSLNAADSQSEKMWRGLAQYRAGLDLKRRDASRNYWLRLDGAGQQSRVYINGFQVGGMRSGYGQFAVDVSDYIRTGHNELLVECDNRVDLDSIPVSADFNFCNGLHGGAVLYHFGDLYLDPVANGLDRLHVKYTRSMGTYSVFVETTVCAQANVADAQLVAELYTREGALLCSSPMPISLPKGEKIGMGAMLQVDSPHLWNGLADPYLHTVKLRLLVGDAQVDEAQTRVGFHTFSATKTGGFFLNGVSYPLRGMAMHQDHADGAIAMSDADIDASLALVTEMGCNFLRLSHYPHREYTLKRCDELGIVVYAEIPWVNHCGKNATDAYFESIKESADAMVRNGWNHACIHLWGMSNEIGGSHYTQQNGGYNSTPQGGVDWDKAKQWHLDLERYIKKLDKSRLVGFTALTWVAEWRLKTWGSDYVGYNIYKGWYGGAFEDFGTNMDVKQREQPNQFIAVSEYGAGGNPSTHSDDPMTTTNTSSGGARHDEEYQNLFHESHLAQIQERPWLLYTSAWVLFDFAVSGRNEGGTPYLNDKGLVTRDRTVKKDAFYLYKAAWRKDIPVVYITSRRFTPRKAGEVTIKAYANTDTLTLTVDGAAIQTLTAPTRAGVVWEFAPVKLDAGSRTIALSGSRDGAVATDSVVWTVEAEAVTHTISITGQPQNASVTAGSISGSLSVTASAGNGAALSYQWYSNATGANSGGTALSGQTGATMAIPTSLAAGTYYYYCVVSGSGLTSVTSNAAMVKVAAAQQDEEARIAWYNLTGTPDASVPDTLPDLTGNGHALAVSGSPVYSSDGYVQLSSGKAVTLPALNLNGATHARLHLKAVTPNGICAQNRLAVLSGGNTLAVLFNRLADYNHWTIKAEPASGTAYYMGAESFKDDGGNDLPISYVNYRVVEMDMDLSANEVTVKVAVSWVTGTGSMSEPCSQTHTFACPGALEMLAAGTAMIANRPDGTRPLGDNAKLVELWVEK